MNKLPYLNIGCGNHFDTSWTNIDFKKTGDGVIAYNLLKGIPFPDNSFELVYHSHVLEHFSKKDGINLMKECYRVLKPNGIIRVAIPDLEQITCNYLRLLEAGMASPNNEEIEADYNWILIEMYDQTIRNKSGGMMAEYLFQPTLPNEDFVFKRIGEEGRNLRNRFLNPQKFVDSPKGKIKKTIKNIFKSLFRFTSNKYSDLGKFRLQGEIHQWMYDRYSLSKLLEEVGFQSIVQRTAFESYMVNWDKYLLDGKDNVVRKPDSLFLEAKKYSVNA